MRGLPKSQLEERDRLAGEIEDMRAKLQDEIEAYNEVMGDQLRAVERVAEVVNDLVAEAQEWMDNIYSDMDGYFYDRSESWQDGDWGVAYAEWMVEFETQLEPVEVDPPDGLEDAVVDADSILNDLPEEPGC